VHAYYYIVKNPVDRIQSPDCLDPAGSGFCRILICLIVCIRPDPKKHRISGRIRITSNQEVAKRDNRDTCSEIQSRLQTTDKR